MDGVFLSPTEDEFVGRIAEELEHFMVQGQHHRVLLFPPLSSRLRYLIHRTVENMELLSSFSVGEGWRRRTVICHSAVRLPNETTSDQKPGTNPPRSQRPAQPWGRGGRGLRLRHPGDIHGDSSRAAVGSGRITRPPRKKPDKALYVPKGIRKKANWRERESPGAEPGGDAAPGGEICPKNSSGDTRREGGEDGSGLGKQQEPGEENVPGKGSAERPPCDENVPSVGNSGDSREREGRNKDCSHSLSSGHNERPPEAGEQDWSRANAGVPGDSEFQGRAREENQSSQEGNQSSQEGNQSSREENQSGQEENQFGQEGNQSSREENQSGREENQSSREENQSGREENQSSREENQSGREENQSSQEENQSSQEENQSSQEENQSSKDAGGLEHGKSSLPLEKRGGSRTEPAVAESPLLLEPRGAAARSPESSGNESPPGDRHQDSGNAEGRQSFSALESRERESPSSAQLEQKPPQSLGGAPGEAVAAPELLRGADPSAPRSGKAPREEEEEEEEEEKEQREHSDVAEALRRGLDLAAGDREGTRQSGLEDDCTAELLAEIVGNLSVKDISIERISVDYSSYGEAQVGEGDLGHVTEIYDFPSSLKTEDLMEMFSDFHESGFKLQWVDDTHALGIFSSLSTASQALGRRYPCLKIRPLIHATKQSKIKALQRPKLLHLGKERPQTDAAVARRLVSHALGWKHRQQEATGTEVFPPESLEQEE